MKIREIHEDLLDIDGDVVHHVHNIAKKFCSIFDNHLEKVLKAICTDMTYCTHMRRAMDVICDEMGKHY